MCIPDKNKRFIILLFTSIVTTFVTGCILTLLIFSTTLPVNHYIVALTWLLWTYDILVAYAVIRANPNIHKIDF